MTPDEFIAWLRERIAAAEAKGSDETWTAATFVSPRRPRLGVRVERVGECSDGGLYRLTLGQCRRLLARAEAEVEAREVAVEATT